MPVGVVVSFVVVFALIMLAVSVGLKFFDAMRKKQVVEMLHTAAGEPAVGITSLLKEIDSDKPSGFKRLLTALQFTRHAAEQIQQAGLNWSPTRLVAAMGLAMIPGLGIGSLVPFLLNRPTTAVTLALVFGATPYLVVRQKRKKRLAPGIPRALQRAEPGGAARHRPAQFQRAGAAAGRALLYFVGAAAKADRRQPE
jgi:Flp pilus assembly protein TadB